MHPESRQALATYRLRGLSLEAWHELCGMLIALHGRSSYGKSVFKSFSMTL